MGTESPQNSASEDAPLVLGSKSFTSRLLLGTGKYANNALMNEALAASGTQFVTVAIRRLDLGSPAKEGLLDVLDQDRYTLLPNTAGCFNVEDALRTARLGRELGLSEFVKLEVLGDQKTLLPDPIGTLEAAKILVAEDFTVLCYTSDDPILAKKLEDVGVAAVMPAGSPIGSGQGILNRLNISLILESIEVPVIVDAGVGTASDVSIAMELGADGVLLNTAVACSRQPVRMAFAMRNACSAGRDAFLAGRIDKKRFARASSPMKGRIGQAESIAGE